MFDLFDLFDIFDLFDLGFILVALLIYIFVFPLIIFSRVKSLERKLESLSKGLPFANQNTNLSPTPELSPTESSDSNDNSNENPVETTQINSPATAPSSLSNFFDWLKQDTLVKVGALLLILALAWFVSYAFLNNWVGPVGRILLGMLFGAGVMFVGILRMRSSLNIGSIFTVVGSTTIIMTITSAQYIYEMFPPTVALGIIFLVVLFITFVSLQYERSQLAYAGLITALVAPFLVNSQTGDPVLLMLYLLLVVAGTLGVVWRLRVEQITLVALSGVIVYTVIAYDLDTVVALLFSFVFTGIFFITNIISLIRRYTEWVSPVHIITAVLTGLYLISSILGASPREWQSTHLLLWALIFAYGSYQVYIRTLNKVPFYIYAGISIVLIGTATIIELEGAILTIVLTLEVLLGVVLLGRLNANNKLLNLATVLLVVPGIFTLANIISYGELENVRRITGGTDAFNSDFFAILIFIGALVMVGMERNNSTRVNANTTGILETGQKILYSMAGLLGATLLWLFLHNLLTSMLATMLALIIFSLIGLALYITGKGEGDSGVKKAGVIILVLVVLRLLLVDVWDLELTGRIITFFIIGLLFMSTAFLPKLKSSDN